MWMSIPFRMFPVPYCFSHRPYRSLTLLLSFASLEYDIPHFQTFFPLCAWHHLLLQPRASEVILTGPTLCGLTLCVCVELTAIPFCIELLSEGGHSLLIPSLLLSFSLSFSLSLSLFLSSCWSSHSDLAWIVLEVSNRLDLASVSFVVFPELTHNLSDNCMHLVVYCISSGIFQAVLSVFFFLESFTSEK